MLSLREKQSWLRRNVLDGRECCLIHTWRLFEEIVRHWLAMCEEFFPLPLVVRPDVPVWRAEAKPVRKQHLSATHDQPIRRHLPSAGCVRRFPPVGQEFQVKHPFHLTRGGSSFPPFYN